jgi:hypothetical protein
MRLRSVWWDNIVRRRWAHFAFRGIALLSIAGASTVCRELVDPRLPPGARRFAPPSIYAAWWKMTESCAGIPGSLASISWYDARGTLRDPETGEPVLGYWSKASNRIVLSSDATLRGGLIRHEMLHALIGGNGHPRGQFLERCGGIVDCDDQCIIEGGPPPTLPPNAIDAAPDSLTVAVSVSPNAGEQSDCCFMVIVTATNPTDHTLTIVLPLRSALSRTFAFKIVSPAGPGLSRSELARDPEVTVFYPHESKQQVFDFVVGDKFDVDTVPPDSYTVQGGYGGRYSEPVSLVVQSTAFPRL